MYQFKYILNDEDYWEFNKFHLLNAPSNKKNIIMIRLFILIFFALAVLVSLKDFDEVSDLLTLIIVYAVIYGILFFAVKPFFLRMAKRQIKNIKKDGKLPYGKDILINFNEDCFIETTSYHETKTKYSVVEKVVTGNTALYIYTSSIQAVIIPFSAFESDEQKNMFVSFINNKAEGIDKNSK
ncbi:MAG: YcxB family protein [Clostridiales bacterium]|nr:YcxB family protein [Clostridiales bacterium]